MKSEHVVWWILGGLAVTLSTVYLGGFYFYEFAIENKLIEPCSLTGRGQFGDMFGAANALLSALAFTAVLFNIRIQSKQLANQEKEAKDDHAARERSENRSRCFELYQAWKSESFNRVRQIASRRVGQLPFSLNEHAAIDLYSKRNGVALEESNSIWMDVEPVYLFIGDVYIFVKNGLLDIEDVAIIFGHHFAFWFSGFRKFTFPFIEPNMNNVAVCISIQLAKQIIKDRVEPLAVLIQQIDVKVDFPETSGSVPT